MEVENNITIEVNKSNLEDLYKRLTDVIGVWFETTVSHYHSLLQTVMKSLMYLLS